MTGKPSNKVLRGRPRARLTHVPCSHVPVPGTGTGVFGTRARYRFSNDSSYGVGPCAGEVIFASMKYQPAR